MVRVMERKTQDIDIEDFEAWKYHRHEVSETHQAEFALK